VQKVSRNEGRNSFIDYAKFLFAIMIVLFHFGNGYCPGGRVAVEGFFMFSGYFMMKSIEKRKQMNSLEQETIQFMAHKYGALAKFLIPSAILGATAICVIRHKAAEEVLRYFMLLFFEIVPLYSLGFTGSHSVGISWYLSSMLFALLILYPLCRKYGARFVLLAALPACLGIYGFLSKVVGSLAVETWMEGFPVPLRLARGFGGCLAGCVLYIAAERLRDVHLTAWGKVIVFLMECMGYAALFYIVMKLPKTRYEYLTIFILFGLLSIGISGVTGLYHFYSFSWTKFFGICSTLFVLNHYYWNELLKEIYGKDYGHGSGIWLYWGIIVASSAFVWISGTLGAKVLAKGWKMIKAH